MNALPFLSAADANPSTAIYVIAAGAVCTGLGWWLRARVGSAGDDSPAKVADVMPPQPVATPPEASAAEQERREREELTARCAALGTKVAELERDARDSAAALAAAQASATTAKAEAAALAAGRSDSEVLAALREEIAAQQSASAALIAEKAALELELKQRTEEMAALIPPALLTAAEAELARQRGEWERRVEELTVALAQAREVAAVTPAPAAAAPVAAHSDNAPLAALKEELEAAKKEITTLKRELSAPKPRPILTSPRPGGNTGAAG